jgi:hypothetical protein
MACSFRAPLEPGGYRLKLDLVMELVCWFEQRGTRPLDIPLAVADEVPDSADPGLLRATLERADGGRSALRAACGSTLSLRVRVRNIGNTLWLARSPGATGRVSLGGHLLSADRKMLVLDFLRASLPHDVGPGGEVEVAAPIEVPSEPGRYVVELDMVDEGIAWFGWEGSPTLGVTVDADAASPGAAG